MVGIELVASEISSELSAEPPSGELAVLPVLIDMGKLPPATVTLCSPLKELATLGRRIAGEDDPDKEEQELTADLLDAIGEVLNLMSGGIDQSFREQLDLKASPGKWWRTDDPGDESLEAGEFLLAQATLAAPDATPVHLFLRVPVHLLEPTERASSQKDELRRFGLVCLPEDGKGAIESVLADAEIETFTIEPEDPHFKQRCALATMLIIGEQRGLEVCRQVRIESETWLVPTLLCLSEPTRETVLEGLDHGASFVLRVPFEEPIELLKVISALEEHHRNR